MAKNRGRRKSFRLLSLFEHLNYIMTKGKKQMHCITMREKEKKRQRKEELVCILDIVLNEKDKYNVTIEWSYM